MKIRTWLSLAAFAVATPAFSASVFLDTFENDTIGSNPTIGVGDIGFSWDNEVNNVDVVANPLMIGNTSSQVLQGNFAGSGSNGRIDGNLVNPIFLDGAPSTHAGFGFSLFSASWRLCARTFSSRAA